MICSAAAQIAAMEAKLASMQSRKPADEDYVPGQSFRPPSSSASPAPASPGLAEDEMDLEEELGLVAGKKAAEDLEKEMAAELAGKLRKGDTEPSRDLSLGESVERSPVPTNADTVGGISSLPPRPASKPPSRAVSPGQSRIPDSKTPTLQKGLANLPKKPSFL